MVKKILEERFVSLPEVKEIMENVYEKLEKFPTIEDNFFLGETRRYAEMFSKMPADVARKVIKMLEKDYSMDPFYAIQIVNIDPSFPEELRVIIEKDAELKKLTDEELTIMIQKIKELQA